MINVGIIGLGKMGMLRYDILDKLPEFSIRLTYDPVNPLQNNIKAHSSEQIIHDESIDAIFISTPNYLNKELTIASMNAGKHVFCEKPPALSSKDVEDIREVEKNRKKVLMYGFNHRHHSSIREMKRIIEEDDFGKLLWMRGRYGKSVDKSFYKNWRAQKKYSGGGILIDQGIHMLDLLLYFGLDFDQIHASVSSLFWKLDVEDNVFATLVNSTTGLSASLHSTMTQWRHLFSLELFLEKGYLVLNGLKTSSNSYGEEVLTIAKNRSTAPAASWEDEENITYDTDDSFESEIREFSSCVMTGKKVSTGNSLDALKLMKIIDKIYSYKLMKF